MILVDGRPVLDGHIRFPWQGAWLASLEVSGAFEPPASVEITDGAQTLQGAPRRGAPFQGRTILQVVGGAGGLGKPVEPKHYQGSKAGDVFRDILAAAGEAPSAEVTPSVLGQGLSFWSRLSGTNGEALSALAMSLGLAWRVLGNGKVWIGEPGSTFEAQGTYLPLDSDPVSRETLAAVDTLWIRPGLSLEGETVESVSYTIRRKLRAHVSLRG